MLQTLFVSLFRFLKVTLLIFSIFFGLVAFFLLGAYFYFARDLANIQSIEDYKPPLISQVLDRNGRPLGEFWLERRRVVPLSQMPPILIDAFVAAEDARFFEHRGVDFRGVMRAFAANLKAREIVQGGSTITQQITRSLLLSRERTWGRKVKEAILATRLERYLNKDQILELYLNQIYFGNRAYGVVAGAQNYFHKNLGELSLAEMALLASLPRAPANYSPLKHPDQARQRQIYVLDRMAQEGIINAKAESQALETKITLYEAGTDKEINETLAPHFLEFVRDTVRKKYGDEKIYHGGLTIHTTLDATMQAAAVRALKKGIEALDKRQGWRGGLQHIEASEVSSLRAKIDEENRKKMRAEGIVFPPEKTPKEPKFKPEEIYKAVVLGFEGLNTKLGVGIAEGVMPVTTIHWARPFNTNVPGYEDAKYIADPRSLLKVGDVILVRYLGDLFALYQEPLVEGALFALDHATGETRAVVGGYEFRRSEFNRAQQALRQPGSSFKPFVYAAALDKGYNFLTMIDDSKICITVDPRQPPWCPENYEGKFLGPTSFHDALVRSRNVPTVKVAKDIGTHYLTAYVRKLGITTPIEKYLSMALGANSVTLEEMATAYGAFANGGRLRTPTFITKIVDREGKVLEETSDERPETRDSKKEGEKGDLNSKLFQVGEEWIKKDGLKLSAHELKILYGANIETDRVITEQTSYLMTKLLEDVVLKGTAQRVRALEKPAAGKTGTTNDETDAWFIGFVPDLLCGVWLGFDDPAKKIGKKEAGGRTASPVFLDFMKEVTKNWEAKTFTTPSYLAGKDIFRVTGGSAMFSERGPAMAFAAARSQEAAQEFLEENLEALPNDIPEEGKTSQGGAPSAPPEETIDVGF